jgi:imidazolonepropionase-like amidohydrolase
MRIASLAALLGYLALGCGNSSSQETERPLPSAPVVDASAGFVDVTVVTLDGERVLPHQTVLVKGDRIVAVGPAATTALAPGATRIDGAGKWLVPGLVDMHVHFNVETDAVLFVANGVTTVRNMWGRPETLDLRERAKKDPAWPGPSVYTSGPILDGNPPRWPGSVVLETPAAAAAEVKAEKIAGYDYLKVYDGLAPEVYDAIAAAAREHGLRVVGHTPKAVPLLHALASGQASIEHMTGVLLALQGAESKAATMEWPAQGKELLAHVDESKLPALAKAFLDAKAALVPTLVVLSRFGALDHPEELLARPENRYVAPAMIAAWDPTKDFRLKAMTADTFALNRDANAARAALMKKLADAGVPVLAGTDTPNPFVVPGFAMHEELELLVAAGFTPAQALHAATAGPAAWLGAEAELGSIRVGARADLVLLDGDPLADITATKRRAGVMVRGTWYPQPELQQKLDELAAAYAVTDRFAGVPALPVDPAAETIGTATYVMTFSGAEVSRERLAVQKTAAGGRVIVAQMAGDPPAPKLVTTRLELGAKGQLTAMTVEHAGGARVVITRTPSAWHVVSTPAGGGLEVATDETLPASMLFDLDMVAAMIPFADRALGVGGKGKGKSKSKGKTEVAGKVVTLVPTFGLSDIAYTFAAPTAAPTPKHRTLTFSVVSRLGAATGTYEVDETGLPTAITLDTPLGAVAITRE